MEENTAMRLRKKKWHASFLATVLIASLPMAAWPQTLTFPDTPSAILGKGSAAEVAWSADGALLAVGGSSGITLYDGNTFADAGSLGDMSNVSWLAFSPDGRLLASGSYSDAKVCLWDVAGRKELAVLEGHTQRVNCVAFSPDGRVFATGSEDKTVRLWDTIGQSEVARLDHTSGVKSVAFSSDGALIAVGIAASVRLWDVVQRKQLATLRHTSQIDCLAFSPDGALLATGSGTDKGGGVRLWDVVTRQQLAILKGGGNWGNRMAFSPNGMLLASGDDFDPVVRLWDVSQRTEVAALTGHRGGVLSLAFRPDGRVLASVGWDSSVRLWDLEQNREQATLQGFMRGVAVGGISFSPDSRTLALASFDGTHLCDVTDGRENWVLGRPTGWNATSCEALFSPDGRTIASTAGDSAVRLWDVMERKEVASLRCDDNVFGLAFSPRGDLLAATSLAGLRLWNVAQRQEMASPWDRGFVQCLAFSPDGRFLAHGNTESVRMWDVSQQVEVAAVPLAAYRLAFSPDSRLLAIAGYDIGLRLRDMIQGQDVVLDRGTNNTLIAFHPGGRLLASAGGDSTVRLWSVVDEMQVAALRAPGYIADVEFSPDGRALAAGTIGGPVALWRTESPTSVDVFRGTDVFQPPTTYRLDQNFPNPFNPATTIPYELSDAVDVQLNIFSVSGQPIRTLVRTHQLPGRYSVVWDGRDDSGRAVASGAYLSRLKVDGCGIVAPGRMLLIR